MKYTTQAVHKKIINISRKPVLVWAVLGIDHAHPDDADCAALPSDDGS